ncbi:MAG: hypothetical protein N2C14_17310, partial [Planctomycetales bacterium]
MKAKPLAMPTTKLSDKAFPCQCHCGAILLVPLRRLGDTAECTACGQVSILPSLKEYWAEDVIGDQK